MHRRRTYRAACRFGLLLVGTLVVLGCRSGRERTHPVSGTVRVGGQPLAGYLVMFRPAQGPVASGRLDADGRFRLTTYRPRDGAVAGVHHVWLVPPEIEFDVPEDEIEFLGDTSSLRPPTPFAAKYLSFATSGLTADVQAGPNEFQFDLMP